MISRHTLPHWLLGGLTVLQLSACAPWQAAGTSKSGHPWIVQSGGTWHKMKGGVQKARHGSIELEQVLDEPDGVSGPQGLIDAQQTLGLASLIKEERVSADNNSTKVLLKKEDTAQITAAGKAEEGILGASAAAEATKAAATKP